MAAELEDRRMRERWALEDAEREAKAKAEQEKREQLMRVDGAIAAQARRSCEASASGGSLMVRLGLCGGRPRSTRLSSPHRSRGTSSSPTWKGKGSTQLACLRHCPP